MTTPKQPNLTTDEKKLVAYLLEQEHDQVTANLRTLDAKTARTTVNAHKVYKKELAKVINKIPGAKYKYGTDL